jgi:hypothetical protein
MADKEHLLAQSSYDFSQGHISRPEEFLNPITQVMNPIFCTPPSAASLQYSKATQTFMGEQPGLGARVPTPTRRV